MEGNTLALRIAFIADGRSGHTRRWTRYFAARSEQLLLLSTYRCPEIPGVPTQALPGLLRSGNVLVKNSDTPKATWHKALVTSLISIGGLNSKVQFLWQQAKITDVLWQAAVVRRALHRFRPDIVHAMRTQNEGYVAALASVRPWLLSSWGQDFIFYARTYPVHRVLTQWAVRRADGFVADCRRDIRLA